MNNKNVYIFWIGEPNQKISENVKKLEAQGLNVFLGPSKKDDEFLSQGYHYYKQAKEEQIWSFASDVWRFFVLSQNTGIYIDGNELIGDEFFKYFSDSESFDASFIKTGSHTISASWMYCGNEVGMSYFSDALSQYEKYSHDEIRLFPVGPQVIQWTMRKYFSTNHDKEITNNICFFEYPYFRDISRYNKIGNGSWLDGNFDPIKYTDWLMSLYVNKKTSDKNRRDFYTSNKLPIVSISKLRNMYDKSNSVDQIKKLKKLYKLVNSVSFSQKLIWSKLYRFFTFKKAK